MVKNESWTSLGKYMEPEIVFNDKEVPEKYGGYCKYKPFGCTINIKEKYINDKGLHIHELTHSRQYGRLFWIHSGLTLASGWYKLLAELEGYRSQVKEYKYTNKLQYEWIVSTLYEKYDLGISKDNIRYYLDYTLSDLILPQR
jgi:hypothetical protein